MNTAYASNGSVENEYAAYIPLLLMGCIFALLCTSIAKRKGKNQWLWAFAGFVPGLNFLGAVWLASLPDKAILEEVKALISELHKFDFVPKKLQTPSTTSELQNWKCNCGITNDINVPICPDCGLKRDFLLLRQQR